MNWLSDILNNFGKLFNWWIVVVPWEQALRIRAGKYVRQFGGGIHLRIPFIDRVYVQNVRDRISATTPQTLTTTDGHTITLAAGVRYRIASIQTLYQTLHQPDATIGQEVEGLISKFVITHSTVECSPESIRAHVLQLVDLEKYGLELIDIFLTDFARVKTYRLIQGGIDRFIDYALNTTRESKDAV